MKYKNEDMAGYTVYEYQLVLNPHEELRHKIQKIKEQFAEAYKTNTAQFLNPYLLLASFTQYGIAEERITNHLRHIAMGEAPMKIELKDYGSFPTHTIFINVTSRLQVQQLVKTIRTETQRLMKFSEESKPHFMLEPHFSIGLKLQPWQFEQAWKEYSHRHFTGRFIADSMLLLKRPKCEKRYMIAQRFEFQNLPVHVEQASLF